MAKEVADRAGVVAVVLGPVELEDLGVVQEIQRTLQNKAMGELMVEAPARAALPDLITLELVKVV
jgi:hypothetical protein